MNPTSDTGVGEIFASLSVGMITLIAVALTLMRIMLLSLKAPRPGRPDDVHPMARGLAEILESLIIAGILVFLIIRPFFVQAFFIPSESMENTLLGHDAGTNPITMSSHNDTVHDHIFVNKLVFRYSDPQHGDIIVFRAPARADAEHSDPKEKKENVLIKRLIGVPGDHILVKEASVKTNDGRTTQAYAVFRNGVQLQEPYIKEPMESPAGSAIYGVNKELVLGPGQLFVMGDNRNDSNDSRYWGTLDKDRVIGKANFIFFPFNRIRILH
jgi:signal peptidase I